MSTPSKTNYFGSKVVPTESNQISEKKGPIWQFFFTIKHRKKTLFLRIFVLSVSVSVFGLRPDIFPVSVSVSA